MFCQVKKYFFLSKRVAVNVEFSYFIYLSFFSNYLLKRGVSNLLTREGFGRSSKCVIEVQVVNRFSLKDLIDMVNKYWSVSEVTGVENCAGRRLNYYHASSGTMVCFNQTNCAIFYRVLAHWLQALYIRL
jgi:hypothetical protein